MRLGIVIPWFGRELKGGAEQQTWQIAARLAQRGHHVEVLTTCCRSHQDDWATNHLPAGQTEEPEGFIVRRFPVEQRNRARFDSVCARLLNLPSAALTVGVSPIPHDEAQTFIDELIKSDALQRFLHHSRSEFDAFILLPYLYGPVIHGVAAVADRACLQPCLHNEPYAYLPQVADAFFQSARVFFNSEGEAELAARLYGPAVAAKSIVVGEGVEVAERITSDAAGDDRFVLYLGRKEPGKNTEMLVRAFRRFRRVRPNSKLRLVLAGHGKIEANGAADWITDYGVVSEAEKDTLLTQCLALAQPSVNESFSRAMMEAWRHGKPVAANRECLATATEVTRAKGGWLAESEDEWAAWFVELDRSKPELLQQLGVNGRCHALVMSDWDKVIDRYEEALRELQSNLSASRRKPRQKETSINQFLPNLSYGDAISNHALWIRNELGNLGYDSDIYARFIDSRVAHECRAFSPAALHETDAAIYHHSIGSEITPHLVGFAGAKCLIYHNITPAELVEPYRPEFAEILRAGRDELHDLARYFPLSYGVSRYNADELQRYGFESPGVLPLAIDPKRWQFRPDESLMRDLQDGRTNILFVGRIAPNKRQDNLVRAFALYRELDPHARLILGGSAEADDPYAAHVSATIAELSLQGSVLMPGSITDRELLAYYRTADLFWSMSEHEGFCVPLVEAMWFDTPILALKSSAVPETLGGSGLMFEEKMNWEEVAALAHFAADDPLLRRNLEVTQRQSRTRFVPDQTRPIVHELVDQLATTACAHDHSAFCAQHRPFL
jgi:glycosyltransferase involved in cell wall biosynthesis